ncbi:MAG TPA: hypothetical protein VLZ06_12765, partial [Solirubrobacteraceae bacterium]|nr:hypothetical protein [Solirubrobacteraceae bacterium]
MALLLCLLVLAGVLALWCAPALAVEGHAFSFSFSGEPGGHPLSEPQGLAIDQSTGDVYVVDKKSDR